MHPAGRETAALKCGEPRAGPFPVEAAASPLARNSFLLGPKVLRLSEACGRPGAEAGLAGTRRSSVCDAGLCRVPRQPMYFHWEELLNEAGVGITNKWSVQLQCDLIKPMHEAQIYSV